MKFVIKLFGEITIKSDSLRRRMISLLRKNINQQLKSFSPPCKLSGAWDKLLIEASDTIAKDLLVGKLQRIPGIAKILEVLVFPLTTPEEMAARTAAYWGERLRNKTFVVRVKRKGKHTFTSTVLEREIGAFLCQNTQACAVSLKDPAIKIKLQVENNSYQIITNQYPGLGGFPLGSQEGVLSLISGGFDSMVASFHCIKRGLKTHFLFFNLGGQEHEVLAKEAALFLWERYASSHPVRFITVPFVAVLNEIFRTIDAPFRGIVLKRMMLKAADLIAQKMRIQALVTGESVAQVASQTLANLALIDKVTTKLVLRPLSLSSKQTIVDEARAIGIESIIRHAPEFCALVSHNPVTKTTPALLESQEAALDSEVLHSALEQSLRCSITKVHEVRQEEVVVPEVQQLEPGMTLVDIRHPNDIQVPPPRLANVTYLSIPFYELKTALKSGRLKASSIYVLYCPKATMSRLQALYLRRGGWANFLVYNPA